MVDPRALRGLVDLAVAAERAGADGVLIGEHVLLGPNVDRKGLPENPRDWVSDGRHPLDSPTPTGCSSSVRSPR